MTTSAVNASGFYPFPVSHQIQSSSKKLFRDIHSERVGSNCELSTYQRITLTDVKYEDVPINSTERLTIAPSSTLPGCLLIISGKALKIEPVKINDQTIVSITSSWPIKIEIRADLEEFEKTTNKGFMEFLTRINNLVNG